MGKYFFVAASTVFILLLNISVTTFPGQVENFSNLNTSSLQDSTNVSASVNANQTNENNVVDQAGSLVNVYTSPNTENRYLAGIFTLYIILLILLLIDIIWLG